MSENKRTQIVHIFYETCFFIENRNNNGVKCNKISTLNLRKRLNHRVGIAK
ncbi:hypothetical protein AN619_15740 [Thermotalea metallivorans]|uniref:Uncharacterized protein n=1 Tax=Thermotalea metallivorans TaxID=520762 RepID=A0A140L4V3_9FIRM|nr:hypothetical protein AN619_15740 [Thermotalea metallivorans]